MTQDVLLTISGLHEMGDLNMESEDDEVLEIIKTGSTNSHMIFEEGKSNLTIYDTPYGQFHLDMHTRT